ncbi:deoxyguanosinetriphosphate triphosphohydrolase, partial [Patescibacteria group bacterium]|nr:deoxyguanosinetriphosphate triphosphohydrolase [Patescibacteria group bacterium]
MKNSKQILEEIEEKYLNKRAVLSSKSVGRVHKEAEEMDRPCFQKDKERVIHCKAFRRLDKKTQVFSFDRGDHFRTRLTHT